MGKWVSRFKGGSNIEGVISGILGVIDNTVKIVTLGFFFSSLQYHYSKYLVTTVFKKRMEDEKS